MMAQNEMALASQAILQMIAGKWVSQALYVLAKLGISDLVAAGIHDSDSLARETGTHPASLYRVLRATASLGVFSEYEPGRFELTPLAECLRSDVPQSLRSFAIFVGDSYTWRPWGELLQSVRTGLPSFEPVMGMPPFEYLARNPEAGNVFDDAMTNFSRMETPALVSAYDFFGITRLVDVAGGRGSLLAEILKQNPHIGGILFDLPSVIEGARNNIEAEGLGGRCEVIAGDFLQSVPQGADAYILKHIIHDWDDERSIAILRNIERSMASDSKVLVMEMVIEPGNEPSFGKLLDLEMLVIPGGQERTEAEYRRLFAAAGLRLTKVYPTQAPISIIEGVRL
jgi:hypothetical protein